MGVDLDAVADDQPGGDGDVGVGLDADADHEIVDRLAARVRDDGDAVGGGPDLADGPAEAKVDPARPVQAGDRSSDVRAQDPGQQHRVAVEDDDLGTSGQRRGRHLGAQEPAAEDADPAACLQSLAQPVAVGEGADVVDAVPLDPGQTARPATGGEHDDVRGDGGAVGEEHRSGVGGDPLDRAARAQRDVVGLAPGRGEQPEAVVPAGLRRSLDRCGRW